MELIDTYYTDEPVIDQWTFVFDLKNPSNGYYTMLATSEDGFAFSQWTEGLYEPDAENAHLGHRVSFRDIGEVLIRHVVGRLEEGNEPAETP